MKICIGLSHARSSHALRFAPGHATQPKAVLLTTFYYLKPSAVTPFAALQGVPPNYSGVPPNYSGVPPNYSAVPPKLSCFSIIAEAAVALLLCLDLFDTIANVGVVDILDAVNFQNVSTRSMCGL